MALEQRLISPRSNSATHFPVYISSPKPLDSPLTSGAPSRSTSEELLRLREQKEEKLTNIMKLREMLKEKEMEKQRNNFFSSAEDERESANGTTASKCEFNQNEEAEAKAKDAQLCVEAQETGNRESGVVERVEERFGEVLVEALEGREEMKVSGQQNDLARGQRTHVEDDVKNQIITGAQENSIKVEQELVMEQKEELKDLDVSPIDPHDMEQVEERERWEREEIERIARAEAERIEREERESEENERRERLDREKKQRERERREKEELERKARIEKEQFEQKERQERERREEERREKERKELEERERERELQRKRDLELIERERERQFREREREREIERKRELDRARELEREREEALKSEQERLIEEQERMYRRSQSDLFSEIEERGQLTDQTSTNRTLGGRGEQTDSTIGSGSNLAANSPVREVGGELLSPNSERRKYIVDRAFSFRSTKQMWQSNEFEPQQKEQVILLWGDEKMFASYYSLSFYSNLRFSQTCVQVLNQTSSENSQGKFIPCFAFWLLSFSKYYSLK